MAEQWLELSPHSKKVLGLILGMGSFSVEFAGCMFAWSYGFLTQSKNVYVKQIGNFIDVCVCLCMYGTLPLPHNNWKRLQQTPAALSAGVSR